MGAQQAFHWGALHGSKTGGNVQLCGIAKTTTQNWMASEGCVKGLELDPVFNGGEYTTAPTQGSNDFAQNYISQYSADVLYKKGFHLKIFGEHKDLQAYRGFFNGYFNSLDANDLLSMVKKWQAGDLGNHAQFGGDWKKSLANIKCPALVMPGTSGICFPT
jgi:homoserine O-acetyltransferase